MNAPGQTFGVPRKTQMIDSVFLVESVRERHRKAPLRAEREKYLTYLIEIGTHRARSECCDHAPPCDATAQA